MNQKHCNFITDEWFSAFDKFAWICERWFVCWQYIWIMALIVQFIKYMNDDVSYSMQWCLFDSKISFIWHFHIFSSKINSHGKANFFAIFFSLILQYLFSLQSSNFVLYTCLEMGKPTYLTQDKVWVQTATAST